MQSYHLFVPFCTQSRILTRSTDGQQILHLDAELTAGFLSFTESYVSKVTCIPFESVQVTLCVFYQDASLMHRQAVASSSTTLFKSLSTTWRFQPLDSKTLVTLDLTFAFQNPLHAAVSTSFFGQVSERTVKAFRERCYHVHGFRN